MPNLTITIDNESKKYLESLGHNPTEVAQRLLDNHLNRVITDNFKARFTKEQKLSELNKK